MKQSTRNELGFRPPSVPSTMGARVRESFAALLEHHQRAVLLGLNRKVRTHHQTALDEASAEFFAAVRAELGA